MKGLHDHPRSNPEERVIRAQIRENLRQKARELSISIITYKDQIQKSLFVHQKRLMESLTSSAPLDNVGYRENCISKVRSAGNMFASHYSKTPWNWEEPRDHGAPITTTCTPTRLFETRYDCSLKTSQVVSHHRKPAKIIFAHHILWRENIKTRAVESAISQVLQETMLLTATTVYPEDEVPELPAYNIFFYKVVIRKTVTPNSRDIHFRRIASALSARSDAWVT